MGDLCADASRYMMGADIGFMNGGGIRAGIEAGDITYEDALSVFPYGNMICMAEVSGQKIKDALEMGCLLYTSMSIFHRMWKQRRRWAAGGPPSPLFPHPVKDGHRCV